MQRTAAARIIPTIPSPAGDSTPIEIVNSVESSVQLLDVDVYINDKLMSGLQFTFNETRQPLVAAVFTVVVSTVMGEQRQFTVSFTNPSWEFTRSLPAKPLMSQPSIQADDKIAKVVVRGDYVHLLGSNVQGLYADSFHAQFRERRQELFSQIRNLRTRVQGAGSAEDIRALLPKGEEFDRLRSILAKDAKEGLLRELDRLESLIRVLNS
jgi:hypothetical protein